LISPSWHVGHVHNAYLELYVDTGVFGIIAFICFAAVVAKLAIDIIYSPRNSPYYGFGIGVLLAVLVTALVSTIESAPFGFGIISGSNYCYILSPIPWVLAGLLVTARQLLRQPATDDSST
jgi:O-antigen ligase